MDKFSEEDLLSVVVFGASGDLAKKKTFPALFNLFCQVKSINCVIASDLSSNKTQVMLSCSSSKHHLFSSAGFSISGAGSDLRICKVYP